MKELYQSQLQELITSGMLHLAAGWMLTYPLMGPVLRAQPQNFTLRYPAAMTFTFFIAVQGANWGRPNKAFHELMCQPAPHGSYLRRTLKEHFPVWWRETSAQLHTNGYSLPEMIEYDRQTKMPSSYSSFDSSKL